MTRRKEIEENNRKGKTKDSARYYCLLDFEKITMLSKMLR
jgi:hypothetical protein